MDLITGLPIHPLINHGVAVLVPLAAIGALLTEWLVGKIGFKGVVELMRDIESLGWKSSFEKHLGKPQESFRDEMADYLLAEYQIAQTNSSWLNLPICKSLDANRWRPEANKGVCYSG